MKIEFETADCYRCGGSGQMPFTVHNGVCFKCTGTGKIFTPAGKRAVQKFQEVQKAVCVVPASSLKTGDKIIMRGARRTVVEVKTTLGKGNGTCKSGVAGTDSYCESWVLGNTVIKTKNSSIQGPAHMAVTLAWTNETLTVAAGALKKFKGATVSA